MSIPTVELLRFGAVGVFVVCKTVVIFQSRTNLRNTDTGRTVTKCQPRQSTTGKWRNMSKVFKAEAALPFHH